MLRGVVRCLGQMFFAVSMLCGVVRCLGQMFANLQLGAMPWSSGSLLRCLENVFNVELGSAAQIVERKLGNTVFG